MGSQSLLQLRTVILHPHTLCRAFRDADAVKRLFRKALGDRCHPQPRVINTDLASIYRSAIPDSKKEGTLRNRCRHRPAQSNLPLPDHVDCFVALNRSPSRLEFSEAGLAFTRRLMAR
jgi:hypothetical protein